jgi:preprotein translocase subunit SecD
MAFLSKKVEEEIQNDLEEIIINKLLNGFTNRKERPVIEVEAVNIRNMEIDGENSDRDNIIINKVHSYPSVWIKIDNDGSKTNDNFQLSNSKPISFTYDNDKKKYVIQNEDQIVFFNTAP